MPPVASEVMRFVLSTQSEVCEREDDGQSSRRAPSWVYRKVVGRLDEELWLKCGQHNLRRQHMSCDPLQADSITHLQCLQLSVCDASSVCVFINGTDVILLQQVFSSPLLCLKFTETTWTGGEERLLRPPHSAGPNRTTGWFSTSERGDRTRVPRWPRCALKPAPERLDLDQSLLLEELWLVGRNRLRLLAKAARCLLKLPPLVVFFPEFRCNFPTFSLISPIKEHMRSKTHLANQWCDFSHEIRVAAFWFVLPTQQIQTGVNRKEPKQLFCRWSGQNEANARWQRAFGSRPRHTTVSRFHLLILNKDRQLFANASEGMMKLHLWHQWACRGQYVYKESSLYPSQVTCSSRTQSVRRNLPVVMETLNKTGPGRKERRKEERKEGKKERSG